MSNLVTIDNYFGMCEALLHLHRKIQKDIVDLQKKLIDKIVDF